MNYDKKIEGKFYPLTPDTAKKLREANLTAAEWRLWSYLVELDPFGDRYLELPDPLTIMQECDMKKSTFYAAIAKLQKIDVIPQWFDIKDYDNVEQKVCYLLKEKLGGLTEVSTSAGRIDLLTDDEIIEVKRINDWKAALGQILVYSAFYPEHRKRIHLFGRHSELIKLPDIEAACLAFDVNVTIEEV
jgi:hypothetical protein